MSARQAPRCPPRRRTAILISVARASTEATALPVPMNGLEQDWPYSGKQAALRLKVNSAIAKTVQNRSCSSGFKALMGQIEL
ncbi:hypothetical protein IQ241_05070 [Romeria aff. gracilis LEGE 07310]|uniref:Uncharacterized protein n=1 Tax=Vasconcelosia minhoensis LEGE 07310 TaxID=915328 RepID=A0A8J7DBN7_9CYAN|nr:hypothetical protein [Romeria gracilis]MBE9076673.1 hypothetical protein [Romeria aff. gracilis LEGE 07310]